MLAVIQQILNFLSFFICGFLILVFISHVTVNISTQGHINVPSHLTQFLGSVGGSCVTTGVKVNCFSKTFTKTTLKKVMFVFADLDYSNTNVISMKLIFQM